MPQVLLLNMSYEPLGVITRRRAVALLVRERVEAACDEAIEVRGVSGTFKIPTVLRLRRCVNVPRRGARWNRKAVLERDGYTCIYCGIAAGDRQGHQVLRHKDFTIDHILPASRGGKNNWVNTACACPSCNQRKGDRMPHEANMRLLWEPKTPRVDYVVVYGEVPAVWKIYLEVPGWTGLAR